MKELFKYLNGNTSVVIYQDGTKVREILDIESNGFIHPESIDVKITNYCDMGCLYCHESSTTSGTHANLKRLLEIIKCLPSGVELAIGGGNPLSHPDLISFLQELKSRGIIANLTVNQGHLKKYQDMLQYLIKDNLVYGIGISITSNNYKYITPLLELSDNIVYHIIAGINSVDTIDKLIELNKLSSKDCKVLVLGYKLFGYGVDFYNKTINDELKIWYKNLPNMFGKLTLSFDNLAIEQLKVKRLFTHKGWEKFYMGDDFTHTMYIDAVEEKYAPTSRNSNRISFDEMSLLEYFNKNKSVNNEILL